MCPCYRWQTAYGCVLTYLWLIWSYPVIASWCIIEECNCVFFHKPVVFIVSLLLETNLYKHCHLWPFLVSSWLWQFWSDNFAIFKSHCKNYSYIPFPPHSSSHLLYSITSHSSQVYCDFHESITLLPSCLECSMSNIQW